MDGCGRSRAASNRRGRAENPHRLAQILQARVALGGEGQRVARDVGDGRVRRRRRLALNQVIAGDDVSDARGRRRGAERRCRRRRRSAARFEIEIDEAVRVVERRPQHLAARQIFEGRGNAAAQRYRRGVERLGEAEARQSGAIGAYEKDRFDQIAARLFDGERGDGAIIERALAHHPIDAKRKLFVDLLSGQFWRRRDRRGASRRAMRGRCGSRVRRP